MAFINKQDTNGTKGTLLKGELGYDDYTAGGDTGRVYVGNGSTNIALAKKTEIDEKQVTLVSGTNIKTVNSTTLLGSGDIAVQPTLVSGTNIKTINSTSLLGSGNIAIGGLPTNSQTFTSSGTFTVPAGVTKIMVFGGHAGAGGGGGAYNAYNQWSSGLGGGGGSPSVFGAPKILTVTAGQTFTVIIASGGSGGAGGTSNTDSSGKTGGGGGTVSFGSYTFKGSSYPGASSGGGSPLGNDVYSLYTNAGAGGFGYGGAGGTSDCNNGTNGASNSGNYGGAGGTGGAGKVIVYW